MTTPKFVAKYGNQYIKVQITGVILVDKPSEANIYSSKYAAKRHLRLIPNVPEGIKIVDATLAITHNKTYDEYKELKNVAP